MKKEKNLVEGIYKKNSKGFGFVKVENEENEIYIAGKNCLNALNEDAVLVKIIQKEGNVRKRKEK